MSKKQIPSALPRCRYPSARSAEASERADREYPEIAEAPVRRRKCVHRVQRSLRATRRDEMGRDERGGEDGRADGRRVRASRRDAALHGRPRGSSRIYLYALTHTHAGDTHTRASRSRAKTRNSPKPSRAAEISRKRGARDFRSFRRETRGYFPRGSRKIGERENRRK